MRASPAGVDETESGALVVLIRLVRTGTPRARHARPPFVILVRQASAMTRASPGL